MRRALAVFSVLCLFNSISPAQENAAKDFAHYWRLATTAYEAKDYPAYFENLKTAVQFRPDNPTMRYNLAGANALVGNKQEALSLLANVAEMGLVYDPAADADFEPIKNSEEFRSILGLIEKNKAPVNHSEVAFKLPEKDLITEGVAYDPALEIFYVGSIHRRKIVSIDKNGAIKDFATAENGLWSVFGMKVDAKRRTLWVCSTVTPQMRGFQKEDQGKSSVFKFDLKTSKLIKQYALPDHSTRHWFGDLTITSRGDVLITDSQAPGAVYAISAEKDSLELFISSEPFRSPQGIALSADEKHLFVADYSIGVLVFDLATKKYSKLAAPANVSLIGIDGMYFYKNCLIAIQNGVRPHRVIRFFLNRNVDRVERAEVVEANNPLFNEPTLGVVVKNELYYVANSQWGSFTDDNVIFPLEKLQEPVILKAKL
jgi:hypothetical protein